MTCSSVVCLGQMSEPASLTAKPSESGVLLLFQFCDIIYT